MAGKQLGTFSTNMSHIHMGSALDTAPPLRPRSRCSSVHSGAQCEVCSKIYTIKDFHCERTSVQHLTPSLCPHNGPSNSNAVCRYRCRISPSHSMLLHTSIEIEPHVAVAVAVVAASSAASLQSAVKWKCQNIKSKKGKVNLGPVLVFSASHLLQRLRLRSRQRLEPIIVFLQRCQPFKRSPLLLCLLFVVVAFAAVCTHVFAPSLGRLIR